MLTEMWGCRSKSLITQRPVCSHKGGKHYKQCFHSGCSISYTVLLVTIITPPTNSERLKQLDKKCLLDYKNRLFLYCYHCQTLHWYLPRYVLQANYNMQLHWYFLWHIICCRPWDFKSKKERCIEEVPPPLKLLFLQQKSMLKSLVLAGLF